MFHATFEGEVRRFRQMLRPQQEVEEHDGAEAFQGFISDNDGESVNFPPENDGGIEHIRPEFDEFGSQEYEDSSFYFNMDLREDIGSNLSVGKSAESQEEFPWFFPHANDEETRT